MSVIELRQNDHNGLYPICRRTDGMRNIYKDHWGFCSKHRMRWRIGRNLYSGWCHESEQDWARNQAVLSGYRRVQPFFWPRRADSGGPAEPIPDLYTPDGFPLMVSGTTEPDTGPEAA